MVTSCQLIVANNLLGPWAQCRILSHLALLPMLQTEKVRLMKEGGAWEEESLGRLGGLFLGSLAGEPWGKGWRLLGS